MMMLKETSSSWTHLVWAAFTWVSLQAWSEFADLSEATRAALHDMAARLKEALDALLAEARETQDQALLARPAAHARQEVWLQRADGCVAEALAIVTIKAGGGGKDHPTVREFLPELASGIARAPIGDRPRLLDEAAVRLERLPDDFAEQPGLAARLREVAARLREALAAHDAAMAAWSGERSGEVVAKRRLRLEMERVHGGLKTVFPGNRGLVASFFRKSAASASAGDGDAADGETPDDGTPDGVPAAGAPATDTSSAPASPDHA
jgi:hypothetical protein